MTSKVTPLIIVTTGGPVASSLVITRKAMGIVTDRGSALDPINTSIIKMGALRVGALRVAALRVGVLQAGTLHACLIPMGSDPTTETGISARCRGNDKRNTSVKQTGPPGSGCGVCTFHSQSPACLQAWPAAWPPSMGRASLSAPHYAVPPHALISHSLFQARPKRVSFYSNKIAAS
jgi:hypothetical protein